MSQVANQSTKSLGPEELAELLKGKVAVIELTAEYLSFEEGSEGEERKFIFTGMSEMTSMEDSSKTTKSVKLFGEDMKMYVTAATVIVGSCLDLPKNTAISIVYLGKEKNKKKQFYDKFKISLLQ